MFYLKRGIPVKKLWMAATAVVLPAALAACGAAPKAAGVHGAANVAYAGSLQDVNDVSIGPAFQHATGNKYQGQGGGSFGVAQEIASKTIAPNVFESVGYAPIQVLEPKFTTWAVSFAASPLVLAYNPKSPFASQLNAIRTGKEPLKDVFTLMANPQFHLGRTNPNTDPQGQAFYMMVELAQQQYNLPSSIPGRVLGALDNPHQIYSETGILSLLQSGGLDASSAFLSEAVQRHLDYIALPNSLNFANPADNKTYAQASVKLDNGSVVHGSALTVDITTLGKPAPAAVAFIRYVLSRHGQTLMKRGGYDVFAPLWLGQRSAVPSGLTGLIK